jgi:sodium/potassium-transporting ATPase subunit alpha
VWGPLKSIVCSSTALRLPAAELVAGDIVKITSGCKIPADLRVVHASSDLRFDRSILTGESNAISATAEATDVICVSDVSLLLIVTEACLFDIVLEAKNIALQGTLCTSGSGIGVCVGLGDATVFGRITKDVARERPSPTTLEIEIRHFVFVIAGLALAVATLIVSEHRIFHVP